MTVPSATSLLRTVALLLVMAAALLVGPQAASANVLFRNASCTTKTNTFGIPPYTITINKPAGVVAGDVLIATTRYSAFYSSVSTPSGWTALQGNGQDSTTWYKVAGSSEPSTYDFTMPSGPGSAAGIISAFSGADPTNTFATAGVQTTSGSTSALVTLPNDVGDTAGSMRYSPIVSGGAVSSTFSAGLSEACDTNGNGLAAAGGYEATGVGTTSTRTDTRSGSGAWVAQTYVIEPLSLCSAGGLNLTTPGAITYPATTLNGNDRTLTTSGMLTVDDQTGTGSGWNVSITSTTFKSGANALPNTAASVTGVTPSAAAGNCVAAVANATTYPVGIPAGTTAPTAVKFFSNGVGKGKGPTDLAANFDLDVPATTRVGSYTSTWTLTLATGP